MTITIDMAPELEQQLERAAARAGLAPEVYIVETLRERLAHPQPRDAVRRLSAREADLLLEINQSLAGIPWERYRILVGKRRTETLTAAERQELIALTDQIETANAQRMALLTELAGLRNVSLSALIQELGLKPRDEA
jgi:hypothetical protein